MNRRDNLKKLADYLLTLPEDYAEFDMAGFFYAHTPADERDYALNNGGVSRCGTAACAVGHGPSAGFLFQEHELNDVEVHWDVYTHRLFCDVRDEDGNNTREFEWMFSSFWSFCDNTPHGAAKRINYYLEHGVPEVFKGYSYRAFVEIYNG
jgi:hypothetical protein